MADELATHHRTSMKVRSASICATTTNMETILTVQQSAQSNAQPQQSAQTQRPPATPGSGRKSKPAARSQSARVPGGAGAVRRKQQQQQAQQDPTRAARCGSEPRLNNPGSGGNVLKNGSKSVKGGQSKNAAAAVTFSVGGKNGSAVGGSGSAEPSPNSMRRKGSSRRATSVYHPPHHRKSAAFLDVPVDDDSVRIRSFSSTPKGIVNRGDSFRRRRSCSATVGGDNLVPGLEDLAPPPARPPRTRTTQRSGPPPAPAKNYRVALIGAPGVGKTALISQFMTSECINAYDRPRDDAEEQTISIMLDGEESELTFFNFTNPKDVVKYDPVPHAFVIVYSVVERSSFGRAEAALGWLADAGLLRTRPALVTANKIDLARSRAVTPQDGKCLACTYKAKFIEISVGINHNVDELLVGILNQIRMKEEVAGTLPEGAASQPWIRNRGMVRATMKARQMFTWIFGKEDSKFKNCENLQIL